MRWRPQPHQSDFSRFVEAEVREYAKSRMSTSTNNQPVTVESVFHHDVVQYREYKLLLRADRFGESQQFHKFWKIARRVAKSLGIAIRKRGKPMETHLREVIFFDTPKFRLFNNGFILRRRTFYERGLPKPEHELVLKFRNSDMETAAAVDVRPLLPCINVVKFKEEILLPNEKVGGMRSIFSHSCELDTPNTMLTQNFETICQVFPALLRTGAKAKTGLSVVNGIAIEEVLVNFGEIDFGEKMTAKATLAIWRNRTTQERFIGEYGFQLKFPSPEEFPAKARELSEAFYLGLQVEAPEWIQLATTKTSTIYRMGKTPVLNTHE
jgi:hypothetical protein